MIRGLGAEWPHDRESALRLCTPVPCPTLVIQGSEDAVVAPARGAAVVARAAAGSEDVLLLGLFGADDEFRWVGGKSKQHLNGGRRRD
jgi:hypothetical protein